MRKRKIAVLTGAGISAESGISTFRDAGGLWEGHDVMAVASPEGWRKNAPLVLDFYNQRRRQLKTVQPNAGHLGLVTLEKQYEVNIITQNVDDLHERAGSRNIIHLHGELRKVRSTGTPTTVLDWTEDCNIDDRCPDGYQLRPHIVWFGEAVPMLEPATEIVYDSDIVVIIGTSMQVYPAASLVAYARPQVPVYYIDPNPSINYELERRRNLEVIAQPATVGVQQLITILTS